MVYIVAALIAFFTAGFIDCSMDVQLQDVVIKVERPLFEVFKKHCSVIQALCEFSDQEELDLKRLTKADFDLFKEYLVYCDHLQNNTLTSRLKKKFLRTLMFDGDNYARLALCCDFYKTNREPRELSGLLARQFKSKEKWQHWCDGQKSRLFLKLPTTILSALLDQIHQKTYLSLKHTVELSIRSLKLSTSYDKDYNAAQFSPAGTRIALSHLCNVLIYDDCGPAFRVCLPRVVRSMKFISEDYLMVGTAEGHVCGIDVSAKSNSFFLITKLQEPVEIIAQNTADNNVLVASATTLTKIDSKQERVWSVENAQTYYTVVAFSPNGKSFSTGDRMGNVVVWDYKTGKPKKKLKKLDAPVCHIAYSNTKTLYAIALKGDQPLLLTESVYGGKEHRLKDSKTVTNASLFLALMHLKSPDNFKILKNETDRNNRILFVEPDEINCCKLVSYYADDKVMAFDPHQKKLLVKKLFDTSSAHRLYIYDVNKLVLQAKEYEQLTAKQLFFLYHASKNKTVQCNERLARCYNSLPQSVKQDLKESAVHIKIPYLLRFKNALPDCVRNCFELTKALCKREVPTLSYDKFL